jgi:hypothetical protein
MAGSYYTDTTDCRAEFWTNIQTKTAIFTGLGFGARKIASIIDDANWAVYVYRTVRDASDGVQTTITAYLNEIASGPNGGPLPAPLAIPAMPTVPVDTILAGFEKRRELWVKEVKGNAGANGVPARENACGRAAWTLRDSRANRAVTSCGTRRRRSKQISSRAKGENPG